MPVCHLQSHLRAWQWGRLFSPSVLVIVISESESLLQWDWPWSQVVAEPAWLRWYHCRDGIRIPIADNLLSLNSWRNVQWNNSINSLGLCFYDARLLLGQSLFITGRAQEALDKNLRRLAIKIHSGFNFLPFPASHKCVNRERAAGPQVRLTGSGVHGPSVTRSHARLVTAARVQHHLQCRGISDSCCRPLNSVFSRAGKDERFWKCSWQISTQCNYDTIQDLIFLTGLYFLANFKAYLSTSIQDHPAPSLTLLFAWISSDLIFSGDSMSHLFPTTQRLLTLMALVNEVAPRPKTNSMASVTFCVSSFRPSLKRAEWSVWALGAVQIRLDSAAAVLWLIWVHNLPKRKLEKLPSLSSELKSQV